MSFAFSINHLDHVAILVKDMERTIQWYAETLGLEKYSPPEWNGVPVMLFANRTGIAVFPAADRSAKGQKFVDHFAFNIDAEQLNSARAHLQRLAIPFSFSDHTYYHSLYMKDPDGHTVELTALVRPLPENA